MQLKTVIVAFILFLLGIILYFSGISVTTHMLKPVDAVSGSYFVVFGIILVLAGSLLLVSQIYRSH